MDRAGADPLFVIDDAIGISGIEFFMRREMLVDRSLSGDGVNVVILNLSVLYMGQRSGIKVNEMLALIL